MRTLEEIQRTRVGLAAAREQGHIGDYRRIMTTKVVERCRFMLEKGTTRQQVAGVIGHSEKSIYKYSPIEEAFNKKYPQTRGGAECESKNKLDRF
jgi:hypothetical protein